MMKVLWLASWYPNESDPYSGDFIKRQAEAVSMYQPLSLVYAGKSKSNTSGNELKPPARSASLEEYILYYPASQTTSIPAKIKSWLAYFKIHLKIIEQFRIKNEMPEIIHVHVAMKAGLIALYLKWKYNIPYVLTEHWSGYYEVARDNLFRKSFFYKYLTRRVLKNASMLIPVSDHLGNQISHYWARVPFIKIPNVVDTRLFFIPEKPPEKMFRFIHISSLLYPKNAEGIIRAFSEFLKSGTDAELVIVGPLNPGISELINVLGFSPGKIFCRGEISYQQVSEEMRKSSALILFSFYENMPCVILEALCTGIPVIASRVGGVPEVVGDHNGILMNAGDEKELVEAMKKIVLNYHYYDRKRISEEAASEYSYEIIGKKIIEIYASVLEGE